MTTITIRKTTKDSYGRSHVTERTLEVKLIWAFVIGGIFGSIINGLIMGTILLLRGYQLPLY